MRTRHVLTVMSLGSLALVAASGCSASSEDEATGGTTGYPGGGTGGAAATGGAGGTETSGGSGGGGSSGGSGGSSGSSGTGAGATGGAPDLGDRIFVACTTWQSNGFVLGCLAVFEDTYVANCTAALAQAAESCAPEVQAVLDCSNLLPVLDYECDSDGDVTFAAGVCESESAALDQCTQ
jgi:hypothetical protein